MGRLAVWVPTRIAEHALVKTFFIEQIDVHLAIDVARNDGGPLWIHGPFDADDLRIALRDVLNVGKRYTAVDLLLQCKGSLRSIGSSDDLWTDRQFADAEQALQASGNRIGHSLSEQHRGARLLDILLRRRRLAGCQNRIGRRRRPGGEQGHNIFELHRGIGTVGELHLVGRTGNAEGDVDALNGCAEIDIENRLDLGRIEERDGALIDRILVAKEHDLALANGDAAEHSGLGRVAAQSQIGIGLQILREWGSKLNAGGRQNPDIELQSSHKAGADRGS